MNKAIVAILFVAWLDLVKSHGFLWSPLARTSVFRLPDHGGAQQPFWWDDAGLWCGNVPQDMQYSTCGRCGDSPGNTHANQGGRYDKGIITGTYRSGSRIRIEVELVIARAGFFEFELCPQQTETDNCFHRLPVLSGNMPLRNGTICIGIVSEKIISYVQLPAGWRCDRCTLRWTYRTSPPGPPNWDSCFNPAPAQTFRNCADIRIE